MPRRFLNGHHPLPVDQGQKHPFSLAEMVAGEEAIVLTFNGGRHVNSRLASLGLTPGVLVNMTQNFGHGPLIVTVRGTRLALGRGEAARILVERGAHERVS